MSFLPFVCLGIGILIGIFEKDNRVAVYSGKVLTVALSLLMLAIGLGIGLDQSIVDNLAKIGLNCAVIALCAILCSVGFTVICEKTILPLKQIDQKLAQRKISLLSETGEADGLEQADANHKQGGRGLVWVMPVCILTGLILGIVLRAYLSPDLIHNAFTVFLIVLYICVGISQGENKEVYRFIKLLGMKTIWLSVAVLVGSILGGALAGKLLGLPLSVSVISAGGMSYYSITGAFMTDTYGLAVGTYGFIVNVMREFFTVLLMPLLIRISLGSPIAAGAAGDMDTMLAPVTKFVGVRLGLVTLLTGTVLTFAVPFLLPILASIL